MGCERQGLREKPVLISSERIAESLKTRLCRRGGMVDTPDLKSVVSNGVPVRVRPAALSLQLDARLGFVRSSGPEGPTRNPTCAI